MSELHFGECPYCDGYIERPFWDLCCFDCQDEIADENAERDERIRDENQFLYSIPSRAANSHQEPVA